jgi:hypothetical protein
MSGFFLLSGGFVIETDRVSTKKTTQQQKKSAIHMVSKQG